MVCDGSIYNELYFFCKNKERSAEKDRRWNRIKRLKLKRVAIKTTPFGAEHPVNILQVSF